MTHLSIFRNWRALRITVNFVDILEILISFHAWYKSEIPMPWDDTSSSNVKHLVKQIIRKIIEYLPRQNGNGWKIQKLHELLHIVEDILSFGSANFFNT
jgi:hypothetical protein